jgi:hypothetical protein
LDLGFSPLTELTLPTGRRVDVIGLGPKGEVHIVEVKASVADFRGDRKWAEYLDYADRFSFAVAPSFPRQILPEDAGLIVADRYGAEVLRAPEDHPLAAARRKAMTLRFARLAADRLRGFADPDGKTWGGGRSL